MRTKMAALLMGLSMIWASVAMADAQLKVTVYGDNGPVQGTIVTARAYVYNRDNNQSYYMTMTGWTDRDGEVTLIYGGHIEFNNNQESTVSVGSGIFSREVKKTTTL
jgi:hypothetical protein